jgi:hypothetical protein
MKGWRADEHQQWNQHPRDWERDEDPGSRRMNSGVCEAFLIDGQGESCVCISFRNANVGRPGCVSHLAELA